MTGFDTGRNLAERFRAHARDRPHLYGCAMRAMADDWEAGGVVRDICRPYEDAPPGSVIQLRLLAGVFRLVLTGRAPELVPFYPCLGGEEPPGSAWPVMRDAMARHVPELQGDLAVAPQTNEVGRSAALLVGLFDLVEASGLRAVRLLEVGASAGLNLLVDRFGFSGEPAPGRVGRWQWGAADSPVQLPDAIDGEVAVVDFTIADRRGCDLHPVDATTPEGARLLTSFVWPFDLPRHQRLAAALQVAAEAPVSVDEGSAGDWLAHQLAQPDEAHVLTVVWHSITQLYWPQAEVDRVAAVLDAQGARRALGRVSMEYDPGVPDGAPRVITTLWSPDQADQPRIRVLGTAHDHGIPVQLTAAPD